MKGLTVFIALFVVAAANAAVVPKGTPNNKNIIDDVLELQKCASGIVDLLVQISDDVLTEVRGLQALVEGAADQVAECSAGIENPSVTDQIQIAKCIAQVYQEFSSDLLNVIHTVQDSLHSIIQLPSIIEECLAAAGDDKGIVEEIEALKICMRNVVDLITQVTADIQIRVDRLQIIIQAGSAQAEECFGDIVNPSASETIEIAKCLIPIYQQTGAGIAEVIVEIEEILLRVAQIPSVIDECMAGGQKNIIDDVNQLKECVQNAVDFLKQVGSDIAASIGSLQAPLTIMQGKAELCLEGVEKPSVSEMVVIAKCLLPVYAEFGTSVSAAIDEIQVILQEVQQVPSNINACLAA